MIPAYPTEVWLADDDRVEYSHYWNSELEEQKKPFWIIHGDFSRMERYLEEVGFVHQLEVCVSAAWERFGRRLHGTGCDLAAGVMWAEPHLLHLGAVDVIYCVECSRHRLLKIGPRVLAHYGVSPEKIVLVLGDFNRLRFPDCSLDFVFMSAAFHHSDNPGLLLREMKRVLKPDGLVIFIGEHIADLRWRHYLTQPAKFAISMCVPHWVQQRFLGRTLDTRRLLPDQREVFAVDTELGDHYYSRRQYDDLFSSAGFQYVRIRNRGLRSQSFVLVRGS